MDMDQMKPILILGAVGAMAYLLMKPAAHVTPPATGGGGTTPPVGGTNPPTGTGTNPPTNTTPPASTLTLKERLLTAAGESQLNPDQWNYYYQQLTGSYANIEGFGDGATRNGMSLSVDQFLAGAQTQGLSGLSEMRMWMFHPWAS